MNTSAAAESAAAAGGSPPAPTRQLRGVSRVSLGPAAFAVGLGLFATFAFAFITVAPNRLVAGTGMSLARVAQQIAGAGKPDLARLAPPTLCLLAWLVLLVAPALRGRVRRWRDPVMVACSSAALATLLWLAGAEAQRQDLLAGESAAPAQRVALGAGAWVLALLAWLAGVGAIDRIGRTSQASRAPFSALGERVGPVLLHAAWWMPIVLLLGSGQLDALSTVKEWAQREEAFGDATARHLQLVGASVTMALALGLPLAVWVARRPRAGAAVLGVLGVLQTMPAVALFGLLIAPLAALGALAPGLGIRGVGPAPALVALVLYALLPVVHSAATALRHIEPAVIEAALGMGLTRRRLLWQVQLPLALPAVLSAARVAAVQAVGLAVLAALVGAGGYGALVFQGLASAATDLVLLGVIPVVALSVVLDAALGLAAERVRRWQPGR